MAVKGYNAGLAGLWGAACAASGGGRRRWRGSRRPRGLEVGVLRFRFAGEFLQQIEVTVGVNALYIKINSV